MRTHTKTFHIRFTEKEYERLCKYAEKAGLPKTTYIRHMINGCCPTEKPGMDYWKMMKELLSVGNNLRQVADMGRHFGSLHAAKLEDLKKRFDKMYLTIMNELYVPKALDVSATLEHGLILAEKEQKEVKQNDWKIRVKSH